MVGLIIEFNSKVPVYKQIYDQIKLSVFSGELGSGEMVPSSRTMAGILGVNYHTVNQAYQLLWKDGIIRLEKGKKYVIAEIKKDENMYREIEDRERNVIEEALDNGMTESEIISLVQRILKGKNGRQHNDC